MRTNVLRTDVLTRSSEDVVVCAANGHCFLGPRRLLLRVVVRFDASLLVCGAGVIVCCTGRFSLVFPDTWLFRLPALFD